MMPAFRDTPKQQAKRTCAAWGFDRAWRHANERLSAHLQSKYSNNATIEWWQTVVNELRAMRGAQ